MLMAACALGQANPGDAKTFNNPVISGFNPDPSICKVGEDYYLVTSSFEYFPGVPVYHSRDLVNWEMIGHALHRPSQLNLDGLECLQGIFAPCIRHHKGTFYMVTTLIGRGDGGFVVTAQNPAGPWSEPHWIKGAPGIDPDLFFDDDGKVYMSGTQKPENMVWKSHNTIWIQELDLEKWELKGERTTLFDAAEFRIKGSSMWGGKESFLAAMEGPHLYKRNGFYYGTFSIGGTGHNHAFAILRSKNLLGPYELNPANPILTHRDLSRTHPITATGHADLVQIDGDDWALVYLGKRPITEKPVKVEREQFILGRETFLSLVDWSGEWPVVNPRGKIGRSELVQERPNLKDHPFQSNRWNEEFSDSALHPQWTFVRTPRTDWWSLAERKGFLRIQLRPETAAEKVNPSFVCKRQEHHDFSIATRMEFNPVKANEEAGLLLIRDRGNYIKFTLVTENGAPTLKVAFRSSPATNDTVVAQAVVAPGPLHLKLSAEELSYSFAYSSDGRQWKTVKAGFDVSDTEYVYGGKYTGPMVGMYASSNGEPSGSVADFDTFIYQPE